MGGRTKDNIMKEIMKERRKVRERGLLALPALWLRSTGMAQGAELEVSIMDNGELVIRPMKGARA